ncbi:MAG: hypothetical protein CMJ58_15910 [Planctomycetaceae bacterium]|nr:hypothetical protein [Planctomycetaceae bacterium]
MRRLLHLSPNFPSQFVALLVAFVLVACVNRIATACPFCSAAQRTLTEEITGSDVAVIASLVEAMPEVDFSQPDSFDEAPQGAKFHIEEVIAGAELLGGASDIEVVYFGEDQPGQKFLITALYDRKLDWITPLPLSDAAIEYVKQLPALPPAGPERLEFFQEHFENADPLIAQDAYDEFSRAPYKDIIDLGPRMQREKLLEWIDDPRVGPSSRRLYLTMLGVCGQPEDIPLLEGMIAFDSSIIEPAAAVMTGAAAIAGSPYGVAIASDMLEAEDRRKKESLDALVACYLRLKGPEGLQLINERFLGNPDTEYKYMHATIMALRFHGEETDVLPREALLTSMRLALDHEEFADQVIPDLTRWQDWEVMDRLMRMFRASASDDWIRQPVASYLIVAAEEPGDVGRRAQAALEEVKALDPEAYHRAQSFPGFGFFATVGSPAPGQSAGGGVSETANADEAAAASATDDSQSVATVAEAGDGHVGDAPLAAAEPTEPMQAPSRLLIIGGLVLGVLVLLAVFAALLKGSDPRSTEGGP